MLFVLHYLRREHLRDDAAATHRLGLGFGWRLESSVRVGFEVRFEGSQEIAANDDGASGDRLGARLTARW